MTIFFHLQINGGGEGELGDEAKAHGFIVLKGEMLSYNSRNISSFSLSLFSVSEVIKNLPQVSEDATQLRIRKRKISNVYYGMYKIYQGEKKYTNVAGVK